MKKSLSVRPSILCVQRLARTSPQRTYRSGWCCSSSATRATSLTKSTARTKFLNLNALVRRLSSSTVQPSSCARSGVIAARVKGGVPPRQGTHFLSASDSAIARPSIRSVYRALVEFDSGSGEASPARRPRWTRPAASADGLLDQDVLLGPPVEAAGPAALRPPRS